METPTSRDMALLSLLKQALGGPTFAKLGSEEKLDEILAAETRKLEHKNFIRFARNSSRTIIHDENYFKWSMKLGGIPVPRQNLKPL
uniref:Uncharacterized protein n=1 Tax=Romanomermis culicivorax TaxID=13658 RepID=A0A915K7B7_ROMCU